MAQEQVLSIDLLTRTDKCLTVGLTCLGSARVSRATGADKTHVQPSAAAVTLAAGAAHCVCDVCVFLCKREMQ